MKLIPGLALYSLMGELKKDYMGTLEKIAKLGYKNIEYAFIPTGDDGKPVASPSEIGAKVKELGLTAISSHVMINEDSDIDAIIAENLVMGAQALVLPFSHMYTMKDVLKIADLCNKVAKKCSENGMKFYYHNHFQEFVKIGDKFALELLLENTDPEYVNIELDTYWVARAGLDPVEIIKKLGSRCKMIHQKDLSASASPVNLFEVLQGPANEESVMGILINGIAKPTDIVEVGTGIMDINEICKTVSDLDYAKYIIVELDHIYNMPPMDSIELSLKNLKMAIG